MNKNDLVNKVSDGTGLSKTDSAKAVDSVFDVIMSELKSGGDWAVLFACEVKDEFWNCFGSLCGPS